MLHKPYKEAEPQCVRTSEIYSGENMQEARWNCVSFIHVAEPPWYKKKKYKVEIQGDLQEESSNAVLVLWNYCLFSPSKFKRF